jgi:hypothetical protein
MRLHIEQHAEQLAQERCRLGAIVRGGGRACRHLAKTAAERSTSSAKHAMASLRRGALLAAAIALCAPTTSGARYYLCAFECAGCGAEAGWTSCRPEPCDAALDEDACADGSTPTRRPLARPPDAPADASDDEAAAHAAVGADFAAALRRNGTEAFLDGPAACLRLLPAPAPVDPSALGVAAGLRAFGRWGTFKERCAVVGKLAFAAERVLAETPAAAVRELSAADACQRSLAAALRGGGVRQLRSCQLAKDERLVGAVRAAWRPRARLAPRAPRAHARAVCLCPCV